MPTQNNSVDDDSIDYGEMDETSRVEYRYAPADDPREFESWERIQPSGLDKLGYYVWRVSASMGRQVDSDSGLSGSWYLSPTQHAVEFIAFNAIFLTILALVWRKVVSKSARPRQILAAWVGKHHPSKMPKNARKLEPSVPNKSTVQPSIGRSLGIWTLRFLMLFTLIVTVYQKVKNDYALFLFQPCHVTVLLLFFVLNLPSHRSTFPSFLFNVSLYTMWGIFLAILFPDHRDYDPEYYEVETFYLEHYLLVFAPFLMARLGWVPILPTSLEMTLFSWAFMCIYHAVILEGVSLVYASNLNYVMNPPPGLLEQIGSYYRIFMYTLSLPVTFLTRSIVVEAGLKASIWVESVLTGQTWRTVADYYSYDASMPVGETAAQISAEAAAIIKQGKHL